MPSHWTDWLELFLFLGKKTFFSKYENLMAVIYGNGRLANHWNLYFQEN